MDGNNCVGGLYVRIGVEVRESIREIGLNFAEERIDAKVFGPVFEIE